MRITPFPFLLCFTLSGFAGEKVQFNRDVRPILSQNCFACHGFDAKTREAELRLDVRESALKRAESGKYAIVPGNVEKSEMWHRINSQDSDEVMPPPKHHAPLSPKQIDVLRRWIEQGAEYQGHWAFVKPEKPAVPDVVVQGGNVLDSFVQATLQEKKMSYAPEASRATLLRRLSFDLIGLPPTPEQILQASKCHPGFLD
jgi:hypothetical protein